MNKVVRILLSCCLGLFISAVFFLGRMWHSGPHNKSTAPQRTIVPDSDTAHEVHAVRQPGAKSVKSGLVEH